MKLIELHIIQSFPVTCLNRDDVGAPKTAVFGGETRARVSSQSWKRAIRLYAQERQPGLFAGVRGHFMAERLQNKIEAHDVDREKALVAAQDVIAKLSRKDKRYKDAHRTSVLLYLSPNELETVANTVAEFLADGRDVEKVKKKGKEEEEEKRILEGSEVKKVLKNLKPRDFADIAIFGRMVADDHSLTLEGAGMFSHALSTHRVSNQIDFFSAVDDQNPEDSAGAGHIGLLEFNAACYYRYVGVNCDLLADADHLGHLSPKERHDVLDIFLRASMMAVPSARHNSMFGHNPPDCILGRVRQGQPLSLANAFENHIRPRDGYLEPSREALRKHHEKLKRVYGLKDECEAWVGLNDDKGPDMDTFIKGLLDNV